MKSGKVTYLLSYHQDGDALIFRRIPRWLSVTEFVWDALDSLSGHRWCNIPVAHWLMVKEDRVANDYRVPITQLQADELSWHLWGHKPIYTETEED